MAPFDRHKCDAAMTITIQPVSHTHTQEEETDISFFYKDYLCYRKLKPQFADFLLHLFLLLLQPYSSSLDKLDILMESLLFSKDKEKSSPQSEPFD